jgi:XTP/dITP diphosphohydrolase
MELIFASNNKGKIIEVQSLIQKNIKIVSLKEKGITEDIEEPFDTFRQNAWAKAGYVHRKTGLSCFAEDSGLVVPALNGAPGVYSARYAGQPTNDEANNRKLLDAIKDMDAPEAYYQSVICLILEGQAHYFEGKCPGRLTNIPKGEGGFGYDPLFIPQGYIQTFAELPLEEKNKISHRGMAMQEFSKFINQANKL